MKRLILLRHAKAEPAAAGDDHARDLSARGRTEAAWAGRAIAEGDWHPDEALVSDAQRTRATFDLLRPLLAAPPRLRLDPNLYDAAPDDILSSVAATAPDVGCLLVVGHNPGLSEVALLLGRGGDPAAVARLRQGLPTAGIAVIALAADDWAAVRRGGTLDALLHPV